MFFFWCLWGITLAEFTQKERDILNKYVSNIEGDIFVVDLPGHLTGALFVRYSRAKTGLKETLLREFLDESGELKIKHADKLMRRILISFGDDSVGELEGIHLSVEKISNIAAKKIEDKRIGGSPIEKSTRYVYYDEIFYDKKDQNGNYLYLRENKIMNSRFADDYVSAMDFIFNTYCEIINPMQEHLKRLKPIEEAKYALKAEDSETKYKISELNNEDDIRAFRQTYAFDIKTKACDTIRCILPASTLTNVGIFGNGRFFQGLLSSLYSDNLSESNDIAPKIHKELNKFIPLYVERANYNRYLAQTRDSIQDLADRLLVNLPAEEENDVTFLENRPEEYTKNLAAQMLYEYSIHPLRQLRHFVKVILNNEKIKEIIDTYIGERKNRRDRPGRALEVGYPFTFDLIGNFGIYRDLHRERMKTQQRQRFTTRLGRDIPEEIQEIGWKDRVNECFLKSESLYEKLLPEYREESQYVVLFGHKIRWSQGENLRELMHELELRTIPQGHPSYRKICQEMHKKIIEYNPLIARTMGFVDHNDYYWSRAESEARQRRKERKLEVI